MKPLPTSLQNSPLVEATFEIYFRSSNPVGEILPGMLYSVLKEDFSQVEPLPLANVPKGVRETDARFRHMSHVTLKGERQTLNLGDRVASLNKQAPYPGWSTFKPLIRRTLDAMQATKLLDVVERYSIKYVNVIESGSKTSPFELLNGSLKLADFPMTDRGFRFRIEFDRDNYVNIVEVTGGATVTQASATRTGTLFSVDTIKRGIQLASPSEVTDVEIDAAHETLKKIFFDSLSKETLDSLGPKVG